MTLTLLPLADLAGPSAEASDGPPVPAVVGGYLVPDVTLRDCGDGSVEIVVGGNISTVLPREWSETALWLLANGMAVAAGFTCHGKDSSRLNPYRLRVPIAEAPGSVPARTCA